MGDDATPTHAGYAMTELDLMLQGARPCAMFADLVPATYEIPVRDFQRYVDDGLMVMREETLPGDGDRPTVRYVYFALTHEAWRIDELHRLNAAVHAGAKAAGPDVTMAMGRLLGYSDAEIEGFQDWWDRASASAVSGPSKA